MSVTTSTATELWRMSATELAQAIRSRQTSSREDAGYAVEEVEPPSIEVAARSLLDMLYTPDIRAGWQRFSPLMPVDTRRFMSAFHEVTGDPDPVTTMQGFMVRQSLLRAWAEFQQEHPLIVAPICTDSPFEAGTDLDEGRVAATVRGLRMTLAVNALGLPAVALPVGVGGRSAAVGAGDRPSLPRGPVPGCRGGAGGAGHRRGVPRHHAGRARRAGTAVGTGALAVGGCAPRRQPAAPRRATRRCARAACRPRTTVRRLRAAWPATRELLADSPAPETSLNRMVGPGRNLALIRTTLDQVKEVAHAHQATANDVLLAVTAGGLRALLRSRGEPVEDTTVPIYVPVSLRARARTSLGSLFGGRIVRRLLLKAVVRQRVNVTTASIPGPEAPLYLAGARALEVFPVLPLIANEPLGVGALSYAGTFAIGVVADQDACPDLDVFTAAMRDDLHALGVATPIPEG